MQDRSGCPDRRKRSRKASDTALAVVAAGIGRVENGEIRPLRKGNPPQAKVVIIKNVGA